MAEGEKTGMGVGKIILIVVLVLVLIGAICCGAAYFMGGKYVVHIAKGAVVMATTVQAELGSDATAAAVPDEEGHFVVLVGIKGELTPEAVTKAQDVAWKAYVKAYEGGGLDVKRVAVGRKGRGQGGVVGWKDHVATAEEVAARTGVPAPPNVEWLDKIDPSKIEVNQNDGGGEDEGDDGK